MDESYKNWLNRVEYPFALREFDSGDGWMNYIDEGQGSTIIFVHGCMTWSFLFRRTIEIMSETHRCIAPDHLGFGLSDKPPKAPYHPADHARRFAAFMDNLGLDDVTLVVHDFGASLGLLWAAQNQDKVRNIVILNSYLWGLQENPVAMRLSNMISSPMNKLYYKYLRATPSFILPPLFADRYRMMKPIQRQYLNPFETHNERVGIYTLVESYKKDSAWFDALPSQFSPLAEKRSLILWGMKDPMFDETALLRIELMFPEAQTIRYQDSGRFFPEEQPDVLSGELQWFLMNSNTPELAVIDQLGG